MSLSWKRIWNFIWHDNSIWSWLVNVVIAFVLVKFVIYPLAGLLLGTSHPVVAVVSGSMEHNMNFNDWWSSNSEWYEDNNISREQFENFKFKNGFNKGDIIVLRRAKDIKIGDVIVYNANRAEPIIHRVVRKSENSEVIFQTKGDNNKGMLDFENDIKNDEIIGKAVVKIPYLGWVKVGFTNMLRGIGIGR